MGTETETEATKDRPSFVFIDDRDTPYLVHEGWLHFWSEANRGWVTQRKVGEDDYSTMAPRRISDEAASAYGYPFASAIISEEALTRARFEPSFEDIKPLSMEGLLTIDTPLPERPCELVEKLNYSLEGAPKELRRPVRFLGWSKRPRCAVGDGSNIDWETLAIIELESGRLTYAEPHELEFAPLEIPSP